MVAEISGSLALFHPTVNIRPSLRGVIYVSYRRLLKSVASRVKIVNGSRRHRSFYLACRRLVNVVIRDRRRFGGVASCPCRRVLVFVPYVLAVHKIAAFYGAVGIIRYNCVVSVYCLFNSITIHIVFFISDGLVVHKSLDVVYVNMIVYLASFHTAVSVIIVVPYLLELSVNKSIYVIRCVSGIALVCYLVIFGKHFLILGIAEFVKRVPRAQFYRGCGYTLYLI